MKRLLFLLALVLQSGLAMAGESPAETALQTQASALQACPDDPARISLAASQSDCCKGHKGVCGCRAGKIVCCDNTTSTTCTCHADSGVDL